VTDAVLVHPEIDAALRAAGGRPAPVVALETAAVTAGLPRRGLGGSGGPDLAALLEGLGRSDAPLGDDTGAVRDAVAASWRPDDPLNGALARAMRRVVRAAGAIPATVAVLDGHLRVGLDPEDVDRLAADESAGKAAAADLAAHLGRPIATGTGTSRAGSAGTTVSATLTACRLAGLRVFATGGIGGVHRGWTARPDVSEDLVALARTPACVVSAGAKSLLDLPATLEALEALGVPVLGHHASDLPHFFSPGPPGALPLRHRIDDPAGIAAIARGRWEGLGQPGGLLVAVPPPAGLALGPEEAETALEQAEADVAKAGIVGAARTPATLEALVTLTGGRSLLANLGLLLTNAWIAGRIAVAMADG